MPRPFASVSEDSVLTPRSLAELGQIIRKERVSQDLRIDDAASLCQVSTGVFSRVENGKAINSDGLLRILSGLGLSIMVLNHRQAAEVEERLVPDQPGESGVNEGTCS